jgi:hypothetical protein
MQSSSTHRVRRSDIEQVSGLAFAMKPYLSLLGGAMIWMPEQMVYIVRVPLADGTRYASLILPPDTSLEEAKTLIMEAMGAPTSV